MQLRKTACAVARSDADHGTGGNHSAAVCKGRSGCICRGYGSSRKGDRRATGYYYQSGSVADYRPDHPVDEKVKKKDGDATLTMERTEDILSYLARTKTGTVSVWIFHGDGTYAGEFPCKNLQKKNADMIVANNLKVAGAGFGTDTNVVTLITADDCRELEIMSKADVASAIVSEILKKMC